MNQSSPLELQPRDAKDAAELEPFLHPRGAEPVLSPSPTALPITHRPAAARPGRTCPGVGAAAVWPPLETGRNLATAAFTWWPSFACCGQWVQQLQCRGCLHARKYLGCIEAGRSCRGSPSALLPALVQATAPAPGDAAAKLGMFKLFREALLPGPAAPGPGTGKFRVTWHSPTHTLRDGMGAHRGHGWQPLTLLLPAPAPIPSPLGRGSPY